MQTSQLEHFKARILEENQSNKTKKRIFSDSLKADIISWILQNRIPMLHASKSLGIAHSTLDKWKTDFKSKTDFKKISVSHPKADKMTNAILKSIKINQIFLTALLVLLLAERIFLR